MQRLVVFVVGAVLAAALVPVAAAAQSSDDVVELALLELDGCFDADQFVVSGGFVATGGCFQGPGLQLGQESGDQNQTPTWVFEPIESVAYGDGIGATRTTFAAIDGGMFNPFNVFSAETPEIVENLPLPQSSAIVYDPGSIAGGRSPSGAERLVIPIGVADDQTFQVGANFAVFTRQPTGPMGETGWDVDLVVDPLDGSVPEPIEFTYEASPMAVAGDRVVVAYETFGDPAVVIADIGTGVYTTVTGGLPQVDFQPFPSVVAADPTEGRAYIGWTLNPGLGQLIRAVTMVDLATGTATLVQGMPSLMTAFTVVRHDTSSASLLASTGAGEVYLVNVSSSGDALTELVASTGAGGDGLTVTELSGSGSLLGVMERTTSFTVAPRAQVRLFDVWALSDRAPGPFEAELIRPDIPVESYVVGSFDAIKGSPVLPPGASAGDPTVPAEDCLVDVTGQSPYPAICFSGVGSIDPPQSLRETYVDALIAVGRPAGEVLWIGQADETPVKP